MGEDSTERFFIRLLFVNHENTVQAIYNSCHQTGDSYKKK